MALLVAWVSTRGQEENTALSPMVADGGMEGRPASLLIDSEPVGASVWVNGDSVGVTPAWMDELAPGVVEVVLRSGSITHDTTLALKPGQDASVLIWLEDEWIDREPLARSQEIQEEQRGRDRFGGGRTAADTLPEDPGAESDAAPSPPREVPQTGRLQITSVPEGATVWIAGERVGTTPLTLDALPAGDQIVELRSQGYETERLRLPIAPNELTTESIALRARPGIVAIAADSGSRVFINGSLEGTVQNDALRLSLAAGRYEVRVFHPEHGEAFRVIDVVAGTVQRFAFERPDDEEEGARRRTGW